MCVAAALDGARSAVSITALGPRGGGAGRSTRLIQMVRSPGACACHSVFPTDGPFAAGTGTVVSGSTLALTMAMAGCAAYCDDLTSPGVVTPRNTALPPDGRRP